MKQYQGQIYSREETVDGVGPWFWIVGDTGTWEGPKTDWEDSHKHKWLSRVKNFDVCIQAGSAQGVYPRLLSDHFLEVFTFEPSSLSFHVMTLNCQKENIHKFNAALGEKSGFTDVRIQCEENRGMNRIEGNGPIPIMTIDSFNFPSMGLIALDVEGYEINVLKGAVKTIERCRPVIVAENGKSSEIQSLLSNLGYEEVDQSISDTIYCPK